MPNQRNRPVKRDVSPGFFGALKDAVGAVASFVAPRGIAHRAERVEGTATVDERKRAQYRQTGNTP